jgi:hypothetical protein
MQMVGHIAGTNRPWALAAIPARWPRAAREVLLHAPFARPTTRLRCSKFGSREVDFVNHRGEAVGASFAGPVSDRSANVNCSGVILSLLAKGVPSYE